MHFITKTHSLSILHPCAIGAKTPFTKVIVDTEMKNRLHEQYILYAGIRHERCRSRLLAAMRDGEAGIQAQRPDFTDGRERQNAGRHSGMDRHATGR